MLAGADVAHLLKDSAAVHARELNLKPSWALTLSEMAAIAADVQEEARAAGRRGVVVTVGTSALEYLAFSIDLFVDPSVPVVVTGAMRKADDEHPDGPNNLQDAVAVAGSGEVQGCGVLVCFAGRLLSARGAYKMERQAEDAFVDTAGEVGQVLDGRITLTRRPARYPRLAGVIDSSVEIIKAYPGASSDTLDGARQRRARGVVIEGTPGVGGIPPTMLDGLRRLVDDGVTVVVSSRAPRGRVPNPPTGGTGSPLVGLPLLSAGDLTTEKAWILLSAALGGGSSPADAADVFARVAGGPDA
jgi:L-asparaginase